MWHRGAFNEPKQPAWLSHEEDIPHGIGYPARQRISYMVFVEYHCCKRSLRNINSSQASREPIEKNQVFSYKDQKFVFKPVQMNRHRQDRWRNVILLNINSFWAFRLCSLSPKGLPIWFWWPRTIREFRISSARIFSIIEPFELQFKADPMKGWLQDTRIMILT